MALAGGFEFEDCFFCVGCSEAGAGEGSRRFCIVVEIEVVFVFAEGRLSSLSSFVTPCGRRTACEEVLSAVLPGVLPTPSSLVLFGVGCRSVASGPWCRGLFLLFETMSANVGRPSLSARFLTDSAVCASSVATDIVFISGACREALLPDVACSGREVLAVVSAEFTMSPSCCDTIVCEDMFSCAGLAVPSVAVLLFFL